MLRVRLAESAEEIEAVRGLLRAYGEHLRREAAICLEDYEAELAGLPGVFAAPAGRLLVAELDGMAVGCVGLKPLAMEGACEVKRLWVSASARGRGAGRALMDVAMREARGAGYRVLYLDTVAAAMPAAMALYGSMGFELVERYNDNPVSDVVFFKRELQ